MDLSKLSTEDLMAMRAGDLGKVSTAGLQAMRAHQQQAEAEPPEPIDIAEGMSRTEKALVGAGGALRKNYLAVRSLFPGGDLTPDEHEEIAQYAQHKGDLGGWGTTGELGTEALLALAPGGLATKGIRAGAGALGETALQQALLRGAGEVAAGAGYGAATSLPGERAKGAVMGGVGSGAGQVLGRALGGVARPVVRPEARALMDEGIQPTLGQAIGGFANTAEQKLTSLPVAGSIISGARNRAVDEFNEAAIRKAAPGVEGFGDEAIGRARDAISAQYDHALSRFPQRFTVDDSSIIANVVNAVDDPALALSDASRGRVLDYVERNILQRTRDMTPEVAKRIESDLGAAVRRFATSADGEERALGQALQAVQQEWRSSLTQVGNIGNRGAGDALRRADAAWRAFLPVDKAAAGAGAQGAEVAGRFTPKQLTRALGTVDKTANDRAIRGVTDSLDPASPFGQVNALSRNATRVLSQTVPDSGTAGRALMSMLAAGGLAANPFLLPKAVGAWAITKGAYSRTGQRALMEGIVPLLRAQGIPDQVIAEAAQRGSGALLALARGTADAGVNNTSTPAP